MGPDGGTTIMNSYPLELFQLQFDFALFLEQQHHVPLQHALFQNTSLFLRLIRQKDTVPDEKNREWQRLLSEMPQVKQAEYFYELYKKSELTKSSQQIKQASLSCFSTFFHTAENTFELHFHPIDPKGNLSRERMPERLSELKLLFDDISKTCNKNTTLFTDTWLLNIEAFNRLFTPQFSQTAILIDSNRTHTNAWWGQFISRDGLFRKELAQTFRENWMTSRPNFNEYFPLPCLRAKMLVSQMVNFYRET